MEARICARTSWSRYVLLDPLHDIQRMRIGLFHLILVHFELQHRVQLNSTHPSSEMTPREKMRWADVMRMAGYDKLRVYRSFESIHSNQSLILILLLLLGAHTHTSSGRTLTMMLLLTIRRFRLMLSRVDLTPVKTTYGVIGWRDMTWMGGEQVLWAHDVWVHDVTWTDGL